MPFTFRVDPKGFDRVLFKLSADAYLAAVQDEVVVPASEIAVSTARGAAPRDTGALVKSLSATVGYLTFRVGSPLAYAPAMDLGRRAGASPPPSGALAGWAARHGFAGSLFVLARSIGRRGIKGRFYLAAATQAVNRALPFLSSRAAERIERIWGH